ncbi:MAG: phosphatidate cytidylyltransferase [Clostridia bacterium]|nr:phosphatidate cytidylyltransferase [Clostridia bacterium]
MTQRIVTGLLLVLLFVILVWLPGWVFALAALIASGFAVWEEYHALVTAGHRPVSWPTWIALIASVPMTIAFGPKVMVPLIGAALLLMAIEIIFREEPKLIDMSLSALPLLTVLLPGLCLVSMSLVDQKAVKVIWLTLTFGVPLVGDVFALLVGTKVGGRKLCPGVSPNKTVAGAIGGLVGSLIASALICAAAAITCDAPTLAKLPVLWQYLLLGLFGGVVGQVGDLFASMVKRHSGIKDFSDLFPGHGGMLDRLDSVFFMAVLMYCFLLFFRA